MAGIGVGATVTVGGGGVGFGAPEAMERLAAGGAVAATGADVGAEDVDWPFVLFADPSHARKARAMKASTTKPAHPAQPLTSLPPNPRSCLRVGVGAEYTRGCPAACA